MKSAFEVLVENQKVKNDFTVVYHANFAVMRSIYTSLVYIVFYGGHVNCTGVAREELIQPAISIFKVAFGCCVDSYNIQAIAATANTLKSFTQSNVEYLAPLVPKGDQLFYVQEYFTGILIRFGKGGSAQIFYSGKVNFLGAKSLKQLFHMYYVVTDLLSNV